MYNHIIPYDEVVFNNCLYTPLFTMLKIFNKSSESFFANNLGTYKETKIASSFFFCNDSISIKSNDDLLNSLGVKTEYYFDRISIIEKVKKLLKKDRLVIVQIDDFYFSKSPFFHKDHGVYYLLVYNYNEYEFQVVGLLRGLGYKTTISYDEFMESINYSDINSINKSDFVYASYQNHYYIETQSSYKNTYYQNLIKNRNLLFDNLGVIKRSSEFYYSSTEFTDIDNNIDRNPIEHILIMKYVELHKHSLFLASITSDDIIKNIIERYKILSVKILKCFQARGIENRQKNLIDISNILNQIYECEHEYLDGITSYAEKEYTNV